MKKFNLVLLVVMALAVGLFVAGCSKNGANSTADNRTKMSDSDLKDQVNGRLKSDPDLRAADLSVRADANNNEVTISGKVDTEALRSRAIELAKSAHPGLVVTDKIDVTPRELGRTDTGTNGSNNPDNTSDTGMGSRNNPNANDNGTTSRQSGRR